MGKDEEIIEKLRRFLEEKSDLDVQSCYFITKRLNEADWDSIMEGEDEEILDDSQDDFGDLDTAETDDTEEAPESIPDLKDPEKKTIMYKRPQISLKK